MSSWITRVEWTTTDAYDEAGLDLLMEHLKGHDAAVAHEHTIDGVATYSATVTVEANTLRQAISAGLDMVAAATGETLTGIEVLPQPVHDHRAIQPTFPELAGFADIAALFGVTRQRARQLADLPGFPPAVLTTSGGPMRTRAAVDAWAANWKRKAGRPAAADPAADRASGDPDLTTEDVEQIIATDRTSGDPDLTTADIEQIIAACNDRGTAYVGRAVALVAYSGLRAHEAVRLLWGDVSDDFTQVTLRGHKIAGGQGTFPIPGGWDKVADLIGPRQADGVNVITGTGTIHHPNAVTREIQKVTRSVLGKSRRPRELHRYFETHTDATA